MAETPEPSKRLHRERLRIPNACQACRVRKAKCDGGRPVCTRCQARGKLCTYSRYSGPASKPPPKQAAPTQIHTPDSVSAARPVIPRQAGVSSHEVASSTRSPSRSYHLDEGEDHAPGQDHADYTYAAHGRFAGEVASAIDRAGLTPVTASNSHLVPFVDAPLFGDIDLPSPSRIDALVPCPELELPPRSYADKLIGIYWQYLHYIEPIFDQDRFFNDYEMSYSKPKALPPTEREIWLCTLYAVFALAVQQQENIPLQRRNHEANHYFQRAWALLRPETILWQPGSLELVQCLMVVNRYLHCTNNQQKTWMTAGLALRIAQSLCFHSPEVSLAEDRQMRRKVVLSCIAMNRCVSWSLSMTLAPSFTHLHVANKASFMSPPDIWALELHEISNQIQLAQTQTRNNLAAGLGLPRLYQQEEYHAVAMQLDDCLNKWESRLPSEWNAGTLRTAVDRTSRSEGYLLHIRLLYTRIYLHRPMLARFYSLKSSTTKVQTETNNSSLNDRLLRECAALCIETSQSLVRLIMETLETNDSIGLLPWWYRVYYLHIAATNFLAAMFVSDLFTESVSQSWHAVLSGLRMHEHLSTYVQQCIRTFESLSASILETRYPTPAGSGDLPMDGIFVDDFFQDVGFDYDSFLFGNMDFTQPSENLLSTTQWK